MSTDPRSTPSASISPTGNPDKPVDHDTADDAADDAADKSTGGGMHTDHTLANEIAAITETPTEAAIDAANGLRGQKGRTPTPEDFEGLLTPAGNSGDIVGTEIGTGTPYSYGENGSLGDIHPK